MIQSRIVNTSEYFFADSIEECIESHSICEWPLKEVMRNTVIDRKWSWYLFRVKMNIGGILLRPRMRDSPEQQRLPWHACTFGGW